MDLGDHYPSQFNSNLVKRSLIKNITYLNKKRKFQDDHLDLPLSKHKCFEPSGSSECESPMNKQQPVDDDLPAYVIYENNEGETSNDGSEHGSVSDSNSFVTNSDSSMSVYGEEKGGPDFTKNLYSLDSRILTNKIVKFEDYHNPEDKLVEFEELVDYTSSEYVLDSFEHGHDNTLEDGSSKMNQNVFVLSSGRWSVKPEAGTGTKKPTIDQEFEQYFSSLML